MIKPFSFFVGFRYTRARRRSRFVSFITLSSVIGIALGVMVLIAVLSVMNGYNQVVTKKFFAIAPQVTVLSLDTLAQSRKSVSQAVAKMPGVIAWAPFVNGKGMLISAGLSNAVEVLGIEPAKEGMLSALPKLVTAGRLSALRAGRYRIALGDKLARRLDLQLGDTLMLLTPQFSVSPIGSMPRYRQFRVGAIFATHSGFGYDSNVAYINLTDAQHLFVDQRMGSRGYHLKLSDVYSAPTLSQQLQDQLGGGFAVTNWTQQYGSLFKAIAMQKTIMFVILTFIVAVAAFNLVSSLVMIVNEKRSDIAILRTLGATAGMVRRIFIFQGAIVGFLGVLLGVVLGCVLSLHLTAWANELQHILGVQWVSADVYWVDYLPSALRWHDVFFVASLAFMLSILATLYPARMACRISPVEALRYE